MAQLLIQRVQKGTLTLPSRSSLVELPIALFGFAVIAIPIGIFTGLLNPSPPKDSAPVLIAYAFISLILPSMIEEYLFRVLMLPHRSESASVRHIIIAATVSLMLFVLWHPMNALLFAPWTKPLFFRLDFLAIAALLGLGSTMLYLRSSSVWPSVIFHWVIVLAWKLALGGSVITFGANP